MPSPKPQKIDFKALEKQGFPERVSKAFQKAADELNCVILSRVPGVATTTLIDEGYNLKPFDIKGKSCNWGPMAGFVCQLPVLNKAGTKKMIGNLNAHVKSLKKLKNKQKETAKRILEKIKSKPKFRQGFRNFSKLAQDFEAVISGDKKFSEVVSGEEFKDVVLPDQELNGEMTTASYLFIPLSISEQRKKELISGGYLGEENTYYKKINNSLIVGISLDKKLTVAIEYSMRRIQRDSSFFWDIYHRNIFVKKIVDEGQPSRMEFVSYLSAAESSEDGFSIQSQSEEQAIKANEKEYNDFIEEFNKSHEKSIQLTPDEATKVRDFFDAQESSKSLIYRSKANRLSKWYPVNGLQSPYLTYTEPKYLYKNAVSGDYDLFSVWPFAPVSGFETTTRISELKSQKSPPGSNSQNLFIPVEAKKYALEIVKSRNVYIEFIGRFDELDGVEDPEVGNINELVSITAQTLNGLVQLEYNAKGFPFPNRAFHSDEGGRPQVDEIEYPIACFMPSLQWSDVQPSKRTGESKEDFKARKNRFEENAPLLKSTAGLVESHVEFLSIVLALKNRFHIFLHDGWIMHLMCLVAGEEYLRNHASRGFEAEGDERKEYFRTRINEIQNLKSPEKIELLLKELITSLKTLPIPGPYRIAFIDTYVNFVEIAAKRQLPNTDERMTRMLRIQLILPE